MRKLNNRGFFLSETLVVATVVTAVVTLLYVTVIGILNNYSKRSYYDNVNSLYTADSIRTLMYNKGMNYFKEKLISSSEPYYSVTCSDFSDPVYPGEEELCQYVYNFGVVGSETVDIVVDKVIFTTYDITRLKGYSNTTDIIEGTTTDYINTIPVVTDTPDYRIILILKERNVDDDDSKHWYTTLKVVGEQYE